MGIPAVAATLTVLLSFLLPTRWTAEAGFIPESSSSIQLPSGISALAGELGFSLPTGDPTSAPDFYAAVTESRSLLERTLLTRFHVPEAAVGDSAALIEWPSWPVCGAGSSIRLSINGLRRFGGARAGSVSEGGWRMRSWRTGITP